MEPTPGVSPGRLHDWMTDAGIDSTAPLTITRLGRGESNLTFTVSDAARRSWVLRRPPAGTTLGTAHDVLREARILRALVSGPVPVPSVLATAEPGALTDVGVVLLEFVDGVVLDHPSAAAALPAQVIQACGPALSEVLAGIHAVDLTETGLSNLASHSSYAQRQLRRWSGQWAQSRPASSAAMDALTERLSRTVPDAETVCLVHGDLHLRNVILSPRDGSVRAVLDWELATLGAPLADVATMLAYWTRPELTTLDEPVQIASPNLPSGDDLVGAYVAAGGHDVSSAELAFWRVLAFWKIAIIVQGVVQRTTVGTDRDRERHARACAMVNDLIEHAHQVAATVGL